MYYIIVIDRLSKSNWWIFDFHDNDDDTDDDNDHKKDSYTAPGAAPGASIINI